MKYLTWEEGAEEIARLLESKSLIPIIGAGFSQGSQCHGGNAVPNGPEATAMMKSIILSQAAGLRSFDLEELDFGKTASLFNKTVGLDCRKQFLRNYFTEAWLSVQGRRFLDYDWPYAYTLNVDDAIERTGCVLRAWPSMIPRCGGAPFHDAAVLYR